MTALLHVHGQGSGFDLPEILLHTVLDFLKLLPFLFLAYLLTEWLAYSAGARTRYIVSRGGRFAPIIGGLLGAIPQCGFSAATAGLYASRVLSLGTVFAVFLSTSDEMLPILLAGGVELGTVFKLIAFKCTVGILLGFAVDGVCALLPKAPAAASAGDAEPPLGTCACGCGCGGERRGFPTVLLSALCHTLRVSLYLFLTMLAFETVVHLVGADAIAHALSEAGFLTVLLSALVGLIPNCAASVVITELWVAGAIPTGAMLAGLLVGSGVGLIVLFRTNRPMKQNLLILLVLLILGVSVGFLTDVTGLSAIFFER